MAPTIGKRLFKAPRLVEFVSSDFVQVSPAYGKNIYKGIRNSILDFQY